MEQENTADQVAQAPVVGDAAPVVDAAIADAGSTGDASAEQAVSTDAKATPAKGKRATPKAATAAKSTVPDVVLEFPKFGVIHNDTPSLRAFPELGEQPAANIKAFTRDVEVQFKDATMLNAFTGNLAQLAELGKWEKGGTGVFLELAE